MLCEYGSTFDGSAHFLDCLKNKAESFQTQTACKILKEKTFFKRFIGNIPLHFLLTFCSGCNAKNPSHFCKVGFDVCTHLDNLIPWNLTSFLAEFLTDFP